LCLFAGTFGDHHPAGVDLSIEEYYDLAELPGVDFVGFGYDARFSVAQDALQVPILIFGYSQRKTFYYPTAPEFYYRVPDEILIRNVAFTEADAYLYNSVDELKNKISFDVGITNTQETEQERINQTCVQTTDQNNQTQTNCTEDAYSNNKKLFSIGANFNYLKESVSKSESFIVENSERTQLFNLFLDTRFIRHEVKEDLRRLSLISFSDNPQEYFKFIERYGTHYVVSANMGGKVTMTSIIEKSSTITTDTVGASSSVIQRNESISRQQALNHATEQFSQQLTAQVDFKYSRVNKNVNVSSSAQWELSGGDSNLVNLLDTRDGAETIGIWKTTITANPVPVQYRMREISTLYDDPTLRKQLSDAVQLYLNFDTDDIINVFYPADTEGQNLYQGNSAFDRR
jgi:hypothetical protein